MSKKFMLIGFIAIVALAFIIVGCSDKQKSPVGVTALTNDVKASIQCEPPVEPECPPVVYDLWAGQTILVGNVTVWNDAENLYVQYNTDAPWYLTEVHLYIATQPFTSRLSPGQAPYKSGDISYASTYTFTIPLQWECDVTIYLQAHAAVVKKVDGMVVEEETAYGGDITKPPKGAWYGNIAYTICCEPPPPPECETAFAYGGEYATCFLDFDLDNDGKLDFNRWGWSNGPLGAGSYSLDIYAAAGQCDLSKGTLVGVLTVNYNGSTASVSFDMASGFTMDESHLYVGSEPLARNNGEYTVAPGQYPYIHDLTNATSDTYTISGLTGEIYVVAHAVVCGNY